MTSMPVLCLKSIGVRCEGGPLVSYRYMAQAETLHCPWALTGKTPEAPGVGYGCLSFRLADAQKIDL